MDILKVLSRGIKKPAQSAGNKAAGHLPANIPSAGTKPQPQLFHDDVGSARAHKRKRSSEDEDGDEDGSAEDLPEVDFFAPRDVSTKPARAEPDPAPQPDVEEEAAPQPSKELSEEECRQILRSHRLKYTLLTGALSKESQRKKKKSKKAKGEEKDKKPEKQGLFPRPLESFSELRGTYGVSSKLAENLAREKYRTPTEVQLGSLPLLLHPSVALPGHDIPNEDAALDFMAVAPTGSGKTISFLIPAVDRILKRREKEGLERIHELEAIVVAPTRELAFQIVNEGRKLTMGTGLRVVQMKKGMEIAAEEGQKVSLDEDSESEEESEEESESEGEEGGDDGRKRPLAKADILVTTPLALVNFLVNDASKGTRILPTVRSLILDEADVLLDPIFLEQTTGVWSACTNPSLQVTLWSATMPSNIETLIKSRLATSPRPLLRLVVGLKDTAVPNITHKLLYTASESGKLLAIRQLLRPTSADASLPSLRPPFLVFTQSIERASALESELRYDIPLEAGGPSRIASLHSGLSDPARTSIMKRFRAGEIWVLITTDVLARGVDFAGVNGIVNYDFPPSSATYVHRAGRTGRAGREGGMAVTFYTKEDIPHAKTVANVIAASDRQAGKTGDAAGVQKWLLDALPDVSKEEKKRLRKGVESRKSGSKAKISSKSGWERKKEDNRKGAIEASKKRKAESRKAGKGRHKDAKEDDGEWGGFED